MQSNKNSLHRNAEGYYDPTAFSGIKDIIKEENEIDGRANALIYALKSIIRISGFELMDRIKIKDVRSGREFK